MLDTGAWLARHRHAGAYATLILSGGYEEAGEAGRFRVGSGDLLFHAPFSAHCDRIERRRTEVLDIPLPPDAVLPARGRVLDADAVVRAAENDVRHAAAMLRDCVAAAAACEGEPADRLAAALTSDSQAIGLWSAAHGLVRETLARQFRRLYGIDAAAYRAEARARRAWRLIIATATPLAEIAQLSGHADQAHMTRAVRALTGHTPGAWRRVTSLQDGHARAA